MPRRGTDRKYADSIALSFYRAKLRANPALRRACSDRHVLDDTIDQWKAEELLDGRQIKGVPRSAIIFSLKGKWKLIDSKVTEENVIVWRDEVDARNAIDVNDKASRIARTVKRIRSSRLELESNRNGLIIDNIDLGAECEGSICRIGYWATQQASIRNESDIDVYCTVKGDAAGQRNIIVEGDSRFELRAGTSNSIKVSFLPKVMGITKSIIVLDFAPIDLDEDDSIENFSIARYIHIRAGDPDDYAILKPTAPYIKKKRRDEDKDKFSNPVRVRSTVVMTPFVNLLGRYPIPVAVQTFAPNEKEAMRKMDNFFRGKGSYFDETEKVDYSSCLTIDNYATCMQLLLWIEEVQMNVDIKSYDLVDTPLMREGRVHYKLLVPGLAENRPSVLKGDTILIHVRGGSNFTGLVHRTTQEYAIMDLPKSFKHAYIDGLRVDVRFTFSRTTLRTSHQALAVMNEEKFLLNIMIFPQLLDIRDNPPLTPLNKRIIRGSQLRFYNRTLNQEQQSAVVGIVQAIARPAPYLIYGPPGTGKTVTLVESILQTMNATGSDPRAKILVVAPSNMAVDVVTERLSPFVTPREMLRIVAFSRDKASIPDGIIEYTNFDEEQDCFITPNPSTVKQYKLVIATISSGGKLPNQGILDHFTHVFIGAC